MSDHTTRPPESDVWEARLLAALPREGDTIRLRTWTEPDVHRRFALAGRDAPWREWNAPYEPDPTEEELATQYERILGAVRRGGKTGRGQRIVIADRTTDTFIGEVSWYHASFAVLNWPALGIVLLDDAFWGKGRGTEALGLWTDLLFMERGCHRVDLRTWSGNHRMCAVAIKLGFVEEARYREANVVDGERYDSVAFGILQREWAERYPAGFSMTRFRTSSPFSERTRAPDHHR